MGFSKPKFQSPVQGRELAAQQQLRSSINQLENAPALRLPESPRFAAPPQSTAADVAAAERMARRNMAGKKGIQYSINPGGQTLG